MNDYILRFWEWANDYSWQRLQYRRKILTERSLRKYRARR